MADRDERLARATCPSCGRLVAAHVPADGDGTAYRPVRHNTPAGTPCDGHLDLVDVSDLEREGRNWRGGMRERF
jgi:hypothetical protein